MTNLQIWSPPETPCEAAPRDRSIDMEKLDSFERLPPLPIPLDRGRIAKRWIPPGAAMLDIGCGAGYHVRHLVRKAARVAAIDVDDVLLPLARRRVRSSRVGFFRYDGRRLPFADASFDAVSMLDVLEHVSDREALVAEVARVLRPGGTWIVSVPYRGAMRWLSPENLAVDHPVAFRWLSRMGSTRFWIRAHNATGSRHSEFGPRDIAALTDEAFRPVRQSRRGSLLYALAYLALCFPPPLLRRAKAWIAGCFALMALDYLVPYGPLSYNLIVELRRREAGEAADDGTAVVRMKIEPDFDAHEEPRRRRAA